MEPSNPGIPNVINSVTGPPVSIPNNTVTPSMKSPKIKLVLICWFNENEAANVVRALYVMFVLAFNVGSWKI